MALTINDFYKQAKSDFGRAVISDMLRMWEPLSVIPFKPVSGLKMTDTRWQVLPSVGNRNLNEGYTESTGQTENVSDAVFAYGGDIKIDRLFRLDKTAIEDPLKTQTQMKVQALMAQVAYDLINGDHSVNPKGFEGFKKRCSNLPARMLISLDQSNDSLKVLASSANRQLFLDGVDKLIKRTGANVLLMNEDTYLGFAQVLRREGQYVMSVDDYGVERLMYGKCKLLDVGLKGDQTTEIITNTEVAPDTGGDATSIYGCRFDETGVQVMVLNGTGPEPYEVTKESESGPQEIHRIDWAIGPHIKSRYALGRLYNFKMAAA
jgi:hypothetical protein